MNTNAAGIAALAFLQCCSAYFSLLGLWLNLTLPSESDLFLNYSYDTAVVLGGQILLIILVFSLFLITNNRLSRELESDLSERRRIEDALQQKNDVLSALQETTLELLSQLDLDTLLENIVKRAGLLMGTTAGYLALVDPKNGQLTPRVGLGVLSPSLEHPVQPGKGIIGIVLKTGEPFIVENYDQWANRNDRISPSIIHSAVGVPLVFGGQVQGVLGLAFDKSSNRAFTQESVDLLTQFAQLVTIGIENARLYSAMQQELLARQQVEEIIRFRLRLWEYAAEYPLEKLMQNALDEIEKLTNSAIGFYHFVEQDQTTIALQVWSTRTLAEFCQAEGQGLHYPIDEAGVWVDCVHQLEPVIHNDYVSLPYRKGLPEGHAELIRELVVPTIRNDKVVAILGVGNKPTDYNQKDVEFINYIADVIWEVVERKRTEEQIIELNRQLEILAMTDELTKVANRRSFFNKCTDEFIRLNAIKHHSRFWCWMSIISKQLTIRTGTMQAI